MAWSADEPTDKNGKEVPEELSEIEKLIKLIEAFIEVVTSGVLDEILKNPETRTKFLDACQTLASVLGDLGAPFAGAIAEVMDLARKWENMSRFEKGKALFSIGWEVASELALGALKKVATLASLALKGGKLAAGLSKLEGTLSALGAAMTTKGINIGEKLKGWKLIGTPGPGVTEEHLEKLTKYMDDKGIDEAYVFGSRQTGVRHRTGGPWSADSDLDIGLPDGIGLEHIDDDLIERVPDVEHWPMCFISTEEAIDQLGAMGIKKIH
jgi:hypothetical protein